MKKILDRDLVLALLDFQTVDDGDNIRSVALFLRHSVCGDEWKKTALRRRGRRLLRDNRRRARCVYKQISGGGRSSSKK